MNDEIDWLKYKKKQTKKTKLLCIEDDAPEKFKWWKEAGQCLEKTMRDIGVDEEVWFKYARPNVPFNKLPPKRKVAFHFIKEYYQTQYYQDYPEEINNVAS